MRTHSKINLFLLIVICFIHFKIAANNTVMIRSLTDGWKMTEAGKSEWIKVKVPGCVHLDLFQNNQIPDPYYRMNEKQLQWIDKKDWEYSLDFKISPQDMLENNVELVFKGLDTYADIYVNDSIVLTSDNMFLEYIVDVKKYIHKGTNNLRVYFHSPVNKGLELLKRNGYVLKANNDQAENGGLNKDQIISPFIRKAPYHFGWDWGPRFVTSGIWKPIFLRFWTGFRISDLFIEQRKVSKAKALANVRIQLNVIRSGSYVVDVQLNGKEVVSKKLQLSRGINEVCVPLKVRNPQLWWTKELGTPYLYNITAKVSDGSYSDSKSHKIGFRSLKLIQTKDKFGHSFYFELNGVPVFAKGENHVPNDMFLGRVTKAVYDWEIKTAVNSNLNILRVWGGGIYEDDYFYDLCDKNGILIWQDFMFACALYPNNHKFFQSVQAEADYQIKRLRNHPSIALWCGNNEIDVAWQNEIENGGWKWKQSYDSNQRLQIWKAYDTLFYQILPQSVRQLTVQTAYWHSTPSSILKGEYAEDNNHDGDVHYWGVWGARHSFERYSEFIGRFISEYGFQSFPELKSVKKYVTSEDFDIDSEVMKHHQRAPNGNDVIKSYMDIYYKSPTGFDKFLYVGQVLQAYGIKQAMEAHRRAKPYNMGSIIWQINDCWPVASWSSCDYYHQWKALQYQIKRSFAPILVSAYAKGDSTKICIVSDLLTPLKGYLNLKVKALNGNTLRYLQVPFNIEANTSAQILEFRTESLSNDMQNSLMEMDVQCGGICVASNLYYFTVPKNLRLLKPSIHYKIKKVGRYYEIALQSNVLVKDAFWDFSGTEGFFSDNYVDVLPGKVYKIQFTPTHSFDTLGDLKILSLYDSYH